jgi:membrane-anchored mycosin MYCP
MIIGTMIIAGAMLAAEPATAAPPCTNTSPPNAVIPQVSWHQTWFAPERVWPFSTGAGITVAVIDSGVDVTHPQLAGRVEAGFDFLSNTPGADLDCNSHGTAVGSIVAAQRKDGIGFVGLAPGARILPVRVTERQPQDGPDQAPAATPAQFAQAIRYAADNGARVINLSVVLYRGDPGVEQAVRYAQAKGALLVAAVGNLQEEGRTAPVPYPAAYDGVLGVGAIDQTGTREGKSQVGPYVDLMAPGVGVIGASRVNGHQAWTGTSFAAPMVAAAAALVWSAEPGLSAADVARRLIATADPARGGRRSEAYGHGVVNPYRAVTERLAAGQPVAAQPLPPERTDPVARARAEQWRTMTLVAAGVGGALAVVAIALAVTAVVLPRGRRRRWLPGRYAPPAPPARRADDDTEDPEEAFFRI